MTPKTPSAPARIIGTLPPISYASVNESGNLTAVMINGTSMTLFVQRSPRPEIADYAVYVAIGDADPIPLMIDVYEKAIKWRDEAIAELCSYISATSGMTRGMPPFMSSRGGTKRKADDVESVTESIIVSPPDGRPESKIGKAMSWAARMIRSTGVAPDAVGLGAAALVVAFMVIRFSANQPLHAPSPAAVAVAAQTEAAVPSTPPAAPVSQEGQTGMWGISTIPAADTWSATNGVVQVPLPSNITSPDQLKSLGFKG